MISGAAAATESKQGMYRHMVLVETGQQPAPPTEENIMAKKQRYPKEVYLESKESSAGNYFVVHETPDQGAVIGKTVEVAIYSFVRMAKIHTGTKLI